MLDYRDINDMQEFPDKLAARDIVRERAGEVQDIPDDMEGAGAEIYRETEDEVQDIPDDIETEEMDAFAGKQEMSQDIPDDEPDYWEMAAAVTESEMHEPEPDVNVPGDMLDKEATMDVPGDILDKEATMDVPGEYLKTEEQQEGTDVKDIREIMEAFQSDTWEGLSDDARKEAIGELGEYVAHDLNIKDRPKVKFYNNEDGGDFGSYSADDNTIYINEYNMDNAVETADTISHETRHCYQHECADQPKTEQDYAFKDNFNNYVTPDMDFEGYEDQIVEADARDYAQTYRDMIH